MAAPFQSGKQRVATRSCDNPFLNVCGKTDAEGPRESVGVYVAEPMGSQKKKGFPNAFRSDYDETSLLVNRLRKAIGAAGRGGVSGDNVSLYFHFQLLTELAALAAQFDCLQREPILKLRTARTVLLTLSYVLTIWWEQSQILILILAIVELILMIWLCSVLFSFGRSLLERDG